jgi:3D (Asp-Asp-Asp) domain-containing protein
LPYGHKKLVVKSDFAFSFVIYTCAPKRMLKSEMEEKQMKKRIKKEICFSLFILFLNLIWVSACAFDYLHKEPVEVEDEWIEETEDIIRWRIDDVEEEIHIEEVKVDVVHKSSESTSLGKFRLTAYCPCKKCTSDGDGITATGTVATQGRTVAVDPSIIPYGTILVINGQEYVAEDNGGKWIQGQEIDIFFDSHDEALEFGIQYAEVFIKEGN